MGEIRNQEDLELPPRARRIPQLGREHLFMHGTTSACAENTPRSHTRRGPSWNYLRVRGEYATSGFEEFWAAELPPRARRILLGGAAAAGGAGTTSACAENTVCAGSILPTTGNYLRVRGEYGEHHQTNPKALELPPRARRIRLAIAGGAIAQGTTSACAENTLNELGLL